MTANPEYPALVKPMQERLGALLYLSTSPLGPTWATLSTGNVDNTYVYIHLLCTSVATITHVFIRLATLQVRCNGVTATCNVAMECNVATGSLQQRCSNAYKLKRIENEL